MPPTSRKRERVAYFPQPVFNLVDERASGSVVETTVRAIISHPQKDGGRLLYAYGQLFNQPAVAVVFPVSKETARGILHQARWHGVPARVSSHVVRPDTDGL